MLLGYTGCDFPELDNWKECDQSLTIRLKRNVPEANCRQVAGVMHESVHLVDASLGVPLLLPYIPDGRTIENQVSAVVNRFACEMPVGDGGVLDDFERYAKSFIKLHIPRLDPSEVKSAQEWLDDSVYGVSRRKRLQEMIDSKGNLDSKALGNKSFIKWEGYQKPKNARGINSYTDLTKVLLGPYVKLVDKCLYRVRGGAYNVKNMQPREWVKKLATVLGSFKVCGTDFTAFEAHHSGVFSDIVNFWMLHCLHGVKNRHLKRVLSQMITGTNVCAFRNITAVVDQRLMSGALWTSSANALLNLLILSYLCNRSADKKSKPEQLAEHFDVHFKGLVEGDDGIFVDIGIDESLIKGLGLKLKLDRFDHFSQASFCGVVCDEFNQKVVMDPLKVLRNFFVLPPELQGARSSKLLSFLRCKALSYKYNLPDCPVIGGLCDAVLQVTAGHDTTCVESRLGMWKAEAAKLGREDRVWLQKSEPRMCDRLLVEEKFGLSVNSQLEIENALGQWPLRVDLRPYVSDVDMRHFGMHFIRRKIAPEVPRCNNEIVRAVVECGTFHAMPPLMRDRRDYLSGVVPNAQWVFGV